MCRQLVHINSLYIHELTSDLINSLSCFKLFFRFWGCNCWTAHMASFLAAPACPLVALPTTTRASFSTVQQKSFSVNVSDTPISNYVTKDAVIILFLFVDKYVMQTVFLMQGGPLFFGLKHAQNIQFSKAASISSTRSRCFKATISCSVRNSVPRTLPFFLLYKCHSVKLTKWNV